MISELLAAETRVAALLSNKELHRSRSDNDSMNMRAVLNASTISTDVLLHLGSMHDSSILHMFPLSQLLQIFPPNGGWLIAQPLSYFPQVYSGNICVQPL